MARADSPLAVPAASEPFRAELTAIDAKWQLTFASGPKRRTLSAADLVCWGECAEQGRGGALVLADGGLLAAEVVAADKERLSANSELFGTLKLPLESLAGIVYHGPSSRPDRDRLLDRIAGAGNGSLSPLPLGEGPGVRAVADSDRLLLDNGDELHGLITGIANDSVTIDTDVGPVPVAASRVTAIIFNPALRSPNVKPRPAVAPSVVESGPPLVWAGFRDGSRLLATKMLLEGPSLTITAAGQSFAAAARDLVFLQPLGGRVTYLSDLKPAAYRQTPFLDLPWPYQPDRNVTGGLLRCGGRLYLKGLGVHSAARLEYEISPRPLGEGPGVRARRFEAELGIDNSAAGQGSVQFRVLVDGQEKFASPIIRGGNPPAPVSVEVNGAKKLELVVDYADRADVLDHADWLNARLTQ